MLQTNEYLLKKNFKKFSIKTLNATRQVVFQVLTKTCFTIDKLYSFFTVKAKQFMFVFSSGSELSSSAKLPSVVVNWAFPEDKVLYSKELLKELLVETFSSKVKLLLATFESLFSEDKTLEKLLGRPTAGLDVAVKQALSH